ncbi:MAG: hypothetical protein RBG13Loki_1760 [Promethearchaeota archaeon CR_4]|nr:MAG: hypothetical protein RBG13Loki_1760 [Candidatus Lokiarchaeota archaeon CR_4]
MSKIFEGTTELLFSVLESGIGFILAYMDLTYWRFIQDLAIPGLHDRVIAATAIAYKVKALISNDPEITRKTPTIWE